jgi:hypothetical protein
MRDYRTRVQLAVILIALVLECSCGPIRQYFDFTRKEPSKTDLIGVWIVDRSSLEYLRARQYDANVETRLILRLDGSFDLVNMPDCWDNAFGEAHQTFKSYSGKWDVSRESSQFWQIFLSGRNVDLLGQKAPYRLSFIIGDPDSGNSIVFVRQ